MKRLLRLLVLGVAAVLPGPLQAAPAHSIRVVLPPGADELTRHTGEVLARQITKRCDVAVRTSGEADLRIELAIEKGIPPEGYQIDQAPNGAVRILASDACGLFYGTGRFLHTSRFDQAGFTPGSWRGTSSPECVVRGLYFATHFNNFYEAAPLPDIQYYIEDLALWGINTLEVTFPRWHYTGFDDPGAQRSLERLRRTLRAAKAVGMKVTLLVAANDAFKSAPKELLRVPVPDALGRHGNFGVNLCPSNPQARQVLLRDWGQLLDQFKDIGLDYTAFWPYDEGGCGCDPCSPWGANGYPLLCQDLARIARAKYPGVKTVVSTWTFDTPPIGEWEGMARFLRRDKSWADFLQADAHEDFPRYPLDVGVPGQLPLLNFPEISMWGQGPWGGYGANPLPGRLQRLWNQTQHKLAGGFPYSEGIYEDLNKVICSQLYWDGRRPTLDTVRDYIAFEFSPDVVAPVTRAIEILETNHLRDKISPSAERAFDLVAKAEANLTPQACKAWRWRILYLRALIDREMLRTKGELQGTTLKQAFNELTTLYHAEEAHSMPIHPPVIQ
ncbi:MAG: hypothetical protein WCQ21_05830 [Verrucomicrobiota bacterium]